METLIRASHVLARLLIGLVGLTLALVVLAIILVAVLAGSERGTGWVLGIAERQLDAIDGVEAQWTHTGGSLFSGLTLSDLDVRFDETAIRADAIALGLAPGALFAARVVLDPVAARGVVVSLPASEPAPRDPNAPPLILEGLPMPERLPMPLAIAIPRLALDGFDLVIDGATVYTLDRLQLGLAADRQGVRLYDFALDSLLADARGALTLDPADGAWRVDGAFDVTTTVGPGGGAGRGVSNPGGEQADDGLVVRLDGQPLDLGRPLNAALRVGGTLADALDLRFSVSSHVADDPLIALDARLGRLLDGPRLDAALNWVAIEIEGLDRAARDASEPNAADTDSGLPLLRGVVLEPAELALSAAFDWHPEGTADAVAAGLRPAPLLPVTGLTIDLRHAVRGVVEWTRPADADATPARWARDLALNLDLTATPSTLDVRALRLAFDSAVAEIRGRAEQRAPSDDTAAVWHVDLALDAADWTLDRLLAETAQAPIGLERLRATLAGQIDPDALAQALTPPPASEANHGESAGDGVVDGAAPTSPLAAAAGPLRALDALDLRLAIDTAEVVAETQRVRLTGDVVVGPLPGTETPGGAEPASSDVSAPAGTSSPEARGVHLALDAALSAADRAVGEARLRSSLRQATAADAEGGDALLAALTLDARDFDLRAFLPEDLRLAIPRAALDAQALIPLDAPEQAEARVQIDDSVVDVNGAALRIAADAALEPDATGGASTARVDRLRIETPGDGHLELAATARLDEQLPWTVRLHGERLIAARILPGVAAVETLRIDALALSGAGRFEPGSPDTAQAIASDEPATPSNASDAPAPRLVAEIDLERLEGRFQGEPLTARGRIQIDGETLDIDALEAALAGNRVRAAGRVDDNLALDVRVEADRLGTIAPELGGQVRLNAQLSGPREAPRARISGRVDALRAPGDVALESATIEARLGLAPSDPLAIDVRLANLDAGGQTIPSLRLVGDGRADNHRIDLDVAGPDDATLGVSLAGGFSLDAQRWTGRLTRLDVEQPLAGAWRLRDAAALDVSAARQRVQDLCLVQAGASLCLSADRRDDGRLDAALDLLGYSFAQLAPLLPPGVSFVAGREGGLDAETRVQIDARGGLALDAQLRGRPGEINVLDANDQPQRFAFGALTADATLRDDRAELRAALDLFEQGRLDADVAATLGAAGRTQGRIRASLPDLSEFEGLVPQIRALAGRFEADVVLDGPLQSPLASGQIALTDLRVTVPDAGLELRAPSLGVVVEDPSRARIDGRIESGEGALTIGGDVTFTDEGLPRANVTIDGQRFLAVARPDVEAEISPELRLAFAPDTGLRLRGTLTIPRARIFPPDLPPGSVGVSADEVIVGQEPTEPGSGLPIDARIRIVLGNDVRFEGFGLEARFAGDLEVIEAPGRALGVFGDVSIPEGQFRAYGQDLRIQRGTVVFQGPPDTPDVDIAAVRVVRRYDVTVGIEVTGTPPDNLRSRVFSQPAMDDTEAMAFLITGRPLSGASQSDGNLIAGAAATFGLEQAAEVTNRIGQELGFDEFGISGEDGLDAAAFTIGKYLAPSLLLRYSVGLFDQSQLVLLRYELTRSLAVETSTGTRGQGIEFLYRIER